MATEANLCIRASFSYNLKLCETENFTPKITKLQKFLTYGRNTTYRCLAEKPWLKPWVCQKLVFSSACIRTPTHVIDIVNKLVAIFAWNGKKLKIKSDTLRIKVV